MKECNFRCRENTIDIIWNYSRNKTHRHERVLFNTSSQQRYGDCSSQFISVIMRIYYLNTDTALVSMFRALRCIADTNSTNGDPIPIGFRRAFQAINNNSLHHHLAIYP